MRENEAKKSVQALMISKRKVSLRSYDRKRKMTWPLDFIRGRKTKAPRKTESFFLLGMGEWIQVRVHSGITWRKEFARSERGSTLVEVDIESRTSWSGEWIHAYLNARIELAHLELREWTFASWSKSCIFPLWSISQPARCLWAAPTARSGLGP